MLHTDMNTDPATQRMGFSTTGQQHKAREKTTGTRLQYYTIRGSMVHPLEK